MLGATKKKEGTLFFQQQTRVPDDDTATSAEAMFEL